MYSQFTKSVVRGIALAIVALAPVALSAQDSAKKATDDSASKWDIFAGYSYLAPTGQVNAVGRTTSYQALDYGGIFSVSRFFNNNVGVEGIGDIHPYQSHATDDAAGGSVGLIFRFPASDVTPFLHALVGTERVAGPGGQAETFGEALTIGGGIDYSLPFYNHHFSFRLVQADFQYIHDNFGVGEYGGRANIKAARLSSGLVYHIGTLVPPAPVTLACSVSPSTPVFPGDPVAATATAGALRPKLSATYTWSGAGVTGTGAAATISTAGQAPGTYTVKAEVKEGPKPSAIQIADCSGSYTVRDFDPPTITCSASNGQIKTTDTSAITAAGVSPQNRLPLTYTYSASAGSVSGSGSSAVYTPAGAGDSTITCTVTDKDGKTASATTTVSATVPYVAPVKTAEEIRLEKVLALHSVFFPTAQPREKTPEIGLVPSQEGTLDKLATDFKSYLTYQPGAHLILTGHADSRGTAEYNKALTDRRVADAKRVLVEKGVSDAAIDTRSDGSSVELTTDQVKALVEQNPDLTDADRAKVLKQLAVIVLAQNRRVDITLSTTGEQSVQLYPFNAADSLTLLDKKAIGAPAKKAPAAAKKAPAKK